MRLLMFACGRKGFLKSLEKRKKYFIPPQQKHLLVIFFKTYRPEEHKVK